MMTTVPQDCFSEEASIDTGLLTVLELLGFENSSWQNDVCPSYTLDHQSGERELRVWVEFDNVDERENPDSCKYGVCYYSAGSIIEFFTIESDKPAQIIEHVNLLVNHLPPFLKGA